MKYRRHAQSLQRQIDCAPFIDRLRAMAPAPFDRETIAAVIDEAARFADAEIDPRDAGFDGDGCRIVNGRVVTSAAQREAWAAFVAAGWPTLALPEEIGGQGLPLLLQTACEELFNRASPAFTMLPTPGRTAAVLLGEWSEEAIKAAWLPKLASGEWAATICISELEAGSDVGRIRTRATRTADGTWRVTGEKCWISFGDHDLAPRIGHCLIARSSDAPGVRGLSLFLVPSTDDDGTRNGIHVRRIEEKMGLHGSPTCALGFEEARALLIGREGRGIQQLFTMMLLMRLSVGPQGVGVAAGAVEAATGYVVDRRQGGPADAPPVPIAEHADVRRQLLLLSGRVEVARGLTLATAAAMDLAERVPPGERASLQALVQWLLPIVKEYGARTGFDVASEAIQLLGGAGYTRDWPIEQAARDARVFAIFEGTSGIQALDMIHRRLWREEGEGLRTFLALARADAVGDDPAAATVRAALDRLEAVSATLDGWRDTPRAAEAGAMAYLNLCALVATGWIALRLVRSAGDDATGRRIVAGARFHLAELPSRIGAEAALALLGDARLHDFAALIDE